MSQKVFTDAPEETKDEMQLFSFISLLSYDVYVKKLIIEKLLDNCKAEQEHAKAKDKTKNEK